MDHPTDLQFGDYRLRGPDGPLLRGSREVPLQRTTLRLLWVLARHEGITVPRNALLDAVWHDGGSDAALSWQINALRKALGASERRPALIRTVHRIGYRFTPAAPGDEQTTSV